jgi:competence protein ComEC
MPVNAVAFVFGVWVLQRQPVLPPLFALAALAAAALALALGSGFSEAAPRRRIAGISSSLRGAACVACCVLGFAWAGLAAQWRLADDLAREAEQLDIRVIGVIASLPQAFDRGLRFDFDIESASTMAAIPGHVALSWYGGYGADVQPPPDMHAGERWSFNVRLHRPHANANPHTFDAEAWMLERGVRAVGSARPGPALLVDSMVWRPGYAIERLREILRERFWDLLPDHRYAGVMIALALGDQNAIPADDWALFARTGVSHLMRIKGSIKPILVGPSQGS